MSGKATCHKVFENKYVLAFLDTAPTSKGELLVIPTALGFPTFLDMPSSKAAELTRELPRLASALQKAMEASDVTVCTGTSAAKATVAHPKFHLVPVYGGKYTKATVTDDSAKDLLAKIDAALHPPKPLKSAKFGQVGKLKPEQKGLNLNVKVCGDVVEKELPKGGKAFEVKVGDASGAVTVSLTEGQKGSLAKDKAYEIRNAYVKMIKGHIALVVDKWGKIEASDADITANTENDVSATEYELK